MRVSNTGSQILWAALAAGVRLWLVWPKPKPRQIKLEPLWHSLQADLPLVLHAALHVHIVAADIIQVGEALGAPPLERSVLWTS